MEIAEARTLSERELVDELATARRHLYDLRFQPKAVHKSDPHGKGTTETLVVLTGSLRLTVDGSEHELGTGDSVFFRADVPHVYENRTARDCL